MAAPIQPTPPPPVLHFAPLPAQPSDHRSPVSVFPPLLLFPSPLFPSPFSSFFFFALHLAPFLLPSWFCHHLSLLHSPRSPSQSGFPSQPLSPACFSILLHHHLAAPEGCPLSLCLLLSISELHSLVSFSASPSGLPPSCSRACSESGFLRLPQDTSGEVCYTG